MAGHQYIDNLPSRSANSLVTLSPGVTMFDGGNIGNAVGLTQPQQVATLPLDALEEFRIITNNYAAEYGHSTGGVVALSTRSGGWY